MGKSPESRLSLLRTGRLDGRKAGSLIVALRAAGGLSQGALARFLTNRCPSWLAHLETGRLSTLAPSAFRDILDAFGRAMLSQAEATAEQTSVARKKRTQAQRRPSPRRRTSESKNPPHAPTDSVKTKRVTWYRCRPLRARLTSDQCKYNKRMARANHRRAENPTSMDLEAMIRIRGLLDCGKCAGVVKMAKDWGKPSTLEIRAQTPASIENSPTKPRNFSSQQVQRRRFNLVAPEDEDHDASL